MINFNIGDKIYLIAIINNNITQKQRMGGCQSNDNQAFAPSLSSGVIENRFKSIEKKVFIIPPTLQTKLEVHTSNGKITDFITKNNTPLYLTYQQFNVESSLDSQHKFLDKQFSLTQQSIGPEVYPQNIDWKRAGQFMKGQYKIFEGKIQPNDIKQGRLGDCYLLSALSSLSEFPFTIKRIFETTEISSYSYYGIWLFIDGFWKCIILDDYFPIHAGKPIFSRNNQNQLWVMLIQKAYAKQYKNYQNIQKGLTGIALNALTGAPFQYFSRNHHQEINIDDAWKFLVSNHEKHHLLIGSSQNNQRNKYMGLVSEHAYSILDVQQIFVAIPKGKKKERILKMSNPWGKYEWKGKWSDTSDIWSEQLKKQLKFQNKDDGIFWINIEDFTQNFGQICCCHYNKNYVSTSIPLTFAKQLQSEFKGIFLRTSQRTEGYITLIQQNHRKFGKMYEYSLVRLIVMKFDKSQNVLSEYICDIMDCDRDATVNVELDPGNYYIVIQVDWKSKYSRDMALNFYGQHPVNMIQDTQKIQIHSLFNQIVLLHEQFTQKQRIYQYSKDNKIKRTTGSIAGYIYYHYANKSTDNNYVSQNVVLKQRKFIDVYGQELKDQFTVKVYPGQERIVKLKVHKDGNSYYSYSTKIQFFIVQKYTLQKLKELADKKPTKVKKRQIDNKQIDVRVKTYNYSGGIVLLYQNKMDKYSYIQDITFEIENLQLQNQTITQSKKLQIELQPGQQKMLSFIISSPGKQIVFRTKISFYLNAPQFKF